MHIIVTGGRGFIDKDLLFRTLDKFKPTLISHGGALGADSLAAFYAQERGANELVYEADWETHGKAAGPIRNRLMLAESPDATVVAFPGGKGTANCVKQARELGMKVVIVNEGEE